MKKYIILSLALVGLSLTSCKDYLTETEPGTTLLSDFYNSTPACIQNVTGCYVPLMWEYKGTYLSEWFIGDIASDDALKGGGSTTDMSDAYDFENWRTTSSNGLLLQFYRAQYQGIGRCNLAIKNLSKIETLDKQWTKELKNRLLGEAYFLRAYYYFRLVRIYGGVPITTDVIDDASMWGIQRSTAGQVFDQILKDLAQAEEYLWLKKDMKKDEDEGRATKGAAQAMLMKVNLYMASPFWQSKGVSKPVDKCYEDAKHWGNEIMKSAQYSLEPVFEDNFLVTNENGLESVFEIQYAEVPWGDYGEGFGYTAGSFTQILIRSRSAKLGGGWGFNHPTQNLYDEFEPGDVRRDVAIFVPSDDDMDSKSEEYYLENKMLNNKYAMYRDTTYKGAGFGKWGMHASRGPLNNRQIRYSDVLLMYAEACLGEKDDDPEAKEIIKQVRHRVGLDTIAPKEVGTYPIVVNGETIANPTTKQALRHERRVELAMEGHRWFDLVRWYGADGGLKKHMEAYQATEPQIVKDHLNEFQKDKHELFPIPQEEIQLNPTKMEQNPGY